MVRLLQKQNKFLHSTTNLQRSLPNNCLFLKTTPYTVVNLVEKNTKNVTSFNTLMSEEETFEKTSLLFPVLKKEEILYLPKFYPRKNFISGLITLSQKERNLLEGSNSSLNSLDYKKHLFFLWSKVFFNFFMVKPKQISLQTSISQGLINVFGFSQYYEITKPNLQAIMSERQLPITQHFITALWANKKIPYVILEAYAEEQINCESYNGFDINMLTFIELYFAKQLKFFMDSFKISTLKYFLVNPEGLSGLPYFFNLEFSKDQTGQQHCDLMVLPKNHGFWLKFYVDFKSFFTFGFSHARFSMFVSNDKLLHRITNDLLVSLDKFLKSSFFEKDHPIILFRQKLYLIKQSKKPIGEKFKEMQEALAQVMYTKEFVSLKVSFAIEVDKDVPFDLFYKQGLEAKIENLSEQTLQEILVPLFPREPLLVKEQVERSLNTTFEILFKEEPNKDELYAFLHQIILEKDKLL